MFWILEDANVNSQLTQELPGHVVSSFSTFSNNTGQCCLDLVPRALWKIKLPAERVEDIFTSQVDHSIARGQSGAGHLFLGRSNRDITHQASPLLNPSLQISRAGSKELQPVSS